MSWHSKELEEVCEKITDGAHHSPPGEDTGYPMASVKDMTPYGLNLKSCRKISRTNFDKLCASGCKPKYGDVLIAKDGNSCLQTVCVQRKDEEVVLLSSIAILRPDQRFLDSRYLKFHLDDITTKLVLRNFISGAAIPRVILKDFRKYRFQIPPLSIQQKIASILSAYDDLIENNLRRIKLLEESARLLYREWFVNLRFPGHEHTRIVNGVPEGWESKPLGEICFQHKESIKPDKISPETDYIGLAHIPRRSITLNEWGKAKEVNSSKFLFKKRDILFGKIRPYFHKVGFTLCNGVTSSDAIVIRPFSPDYYHFLLMYVSSDAFVLFASKTVKEGSKMPRADWNFLIQQPVLLPKHNLISIFSTHIDNIQQQLELLASQNHKLKAARDLLLSRLMNGEITV